MKIKKRVCVYCNGENGASLSREHTISRSVLEELLGVDMQSITKLPNGKVLIDTEDIIRDVCSKCNSKLSQIDNAGLYFTKTMSNKYLASNFRFSISKELIKWFIKTHLNKLRTIKDIVDNRYHIISPLIFEQIISQTPLNDNLLELYIEGIDGREYYWEKEHSKKIQIVNYKSLISIKEDIVISYLRVKFISTYIFLPRDNNYNNFSKRVERVKKEIEQNFPIQMQRLYMVDEYNSFECRYVCLNSIVNKYINNNKLDRFVNLD